jgi:glucuronate isomerase
MTKPLTLNEDRLFPAEAGARVHARALYEHIRDLPIISPHGHTDPAWFASNAAFSNATELLLTPDHYLLRMLYSQGVALEELGVAPRTGASTADPREAWRLFARNFYLFRGTPSALWLNFVFRKLFEIDVVLDGETADRYYDAIGEKLAQPGFRPRALFDRFNVEVLSTTEAPDDPLTHHQTLRRSDWNGRIVPTYRPDPVVDPEHEDFAAALERFAAVSGKDVRSWPHYLAAHRERRAVFAAMAPRRPITAIRR